jgi:hypothetical protein
MRTLRNIGISLVVVAVLGGAAFLALRSVSKSNDYGTGGGGNASGPSTGSVGTHGAMTVAEERSIRIGTSKTAVVARFGTPASTDAQELTGCVYYRMPNTIVHTWQLCFTDGRLASKSRA